MCEVSKRIERLEGKKKIVLFTIVRKRFIHATDAKSSTENT